MTEFGHIYNENNREQDGFAEVFDSAEELLERHAVYSYEKQLFFGEYIGSRNWNVDMNVGKIEFGTDFKFDMQILGTFSHGAQTWLWAWGNQQSGIQEKLMQQALKLKAYGEQHRLDLLQQRSYDFSKEELHYIGMIAVGMFDVTAYYLADYGQGVMLLTINSPKLDSERLASSDPMQTIFPQFISNVDVKHLGAFIGYLKSKKMKLRKDENWIVGESEGKCVKAQFDEQGRMLEFKIEA